MTAADEAASADPAASGRRTAKSATAFRTISEVADDIAVPQHVLRFWETKFPQIRPLKRGGGRRYYRPEDVELLRRVAQLLYQEGYTIRGVQRLLREGTIKNPPPPAELAATLPLDLDDGGDAFTLESPEEPAPPARTAAVAEPVVSSGSGPAPESHPVESQPALRPDPLSRSLLEDLLAELQAIRALLPTRS